MTAHAPPENNGVDVVEENVVADNTVKHMVIPDAIGEWWVHPIATTLPEQGRTVAGAIASDGTILATSFDHATGTTERITVGTTQPDDHNVPSLWVRPGRRPVMMWTRHNHDDVVYTRVGEAGGDLATLATAPPQDAQAPAEISYTQLHRITHLSDDEQDTFLVLSRIATLNWHLRLLSVDQHTGTVTWQPWVPFMQSAGQCYLITAEAHGSAGDVSGSGEPANQTLRVAWSYNPAQPFSAIRYVEIDLVTGAVSCPVDPTIEANIYEPVGLPLIDSEVAPLIAEPPAHHSRRLFYVRPGPSSAGIAYADWERDKPDEAIYRTLVLQDGRWVVRDHGVSGERIGFTPEANYISGIAFPSPCETDTIYATRVSGSTSSVERIDVDGDGQVTTTIHLDADHRWARPVPPHEGGQSVIAYEIERYGEHFTEYRANARLFR